MYGSYAVRRHRQFATVWINEWSGFISMADRKLTERSQVKLDGQGKARREPPVAAIPSAKSI